METFCPMEMCSACGACLCACPTGSISMRRDDKGFLLPYIDHETCIDCNQCIGICPGLRETADAPILRVLAAVNKNELVRKSSSSGGIFTLLAADAIDRGGVVYGVTQIDALQVKHIAINQVCEIGKLCGSKYIQSDTGVCYQEIKKLLIAGERVLFSGTPCQVYGLNAFLNDNIYENLTTIDLVCHGVTSNLTLESYLKEKRLSACDIMVNYRDKSSGWHQVSLTLNDLEKMTQVNCEIFSESVFGKAFIANLYLRKSCYTCNMKTNHSLADISLGDFWGVENIHADFDDDRGTSVVVIHTKKGMDLIEKIQNQMNIREVSFAAACAENWAMERAAKYPVDWEKAFDILELSSISGACAKYCRRSFLQRIKKCVKRLIALGR